MCAQEWFETKVMIAAEEARRGGFEQTYLALLDVLRTSRYSEERMVGSLSVSFPIVSLHSGSNGKVSSFATDLTSR